MGNDAGSHFVPSKPDNLPDITARFYYHRSPAFQHSVAVVLPVTDTISSFV